MGPVYGLTWPSRSRDSPSLACSPCCHGHIQGNSKQLQGNSKQPTFLMVGYLNWMMMNHIITWKMGGITISIHLKLVVWGSRKYIINYILGKSTSNWISDEKKQYTNKMAFHPIPSPFPTNFFLAGATRNNFQCVSWCHRHYRENYILCFGSGDLKRKKTFTLDIVLLRTNNRISIFPSSSVRSLHIWNLWLPGKPIYQVTRSLVPNI